MVTRQCLWRVAGATTAAQRRFFLPADPAPQFDYEVFFHTEQDLKNASFEFIRELFIIISYLSKWTKTCLYSIKLSPHKIILNGLQSHEQRKKKYMGRGARA